MARTARSRGHRSARSRGQALAGWGAAGLGAAALLWLVVATGFASLAHDSRPDAALAVYPVDAFALARKSDGALAGGVTKSAALDAIRWSAASLRRDPTSVAAWRNLGLSKVALGEAGAGFQVLQFAERLSRRDTGVQLTLLEAAVQRGDIAEALKHYDLIFRVSPTRDQLLMPILVAASADPQIRPQLVALISRSPGWRRRFYSALVASPPAPEATATLVEQLASAGALSDRDIVGTIAYNLGMSGQDAAAWRVYAALKPGHRTAVRNGGFEDAAPVAPFDWLLETNDPVLAAVSASGAGHRLELTSSRGDAGPGARQLLELVPGAYRLGFDAGVLAGLASPVLYWQLRCSKGGAPLISGSGAPSRTTTLFMVPASGCAGQWLEFGFQAANSDAAAGAWLDQVSVSLAS